MKAFSAVVGGVVLCAATAASGDPLPGAPPVPAELASRLEAADADRGADSPPRTRHLTSDGRPLFTNRLALESSPYLLQHSHNPVNWYPWGEEAFEAASKLGRVVFLSVGYSTCHWCHVMEEESFEDPEIAEFMNRHFISIKVDREERPDIDNIYMAAVRSLTGSGGWPMSVFLTPEAQPFYGGTYFPPRDGMRRGRPGFLTILQRVQDTYSKDPARVRLGSDALAEELKRGLDPPTAVGMPSTQELRRALATYQGQFDPENAGLRRRTKFPSSLPIPFLLRIHRRTGEDEPLEMARKTLDAMRQGGIYDHVGGGFHRYTVEPTWTVPHFEKMLYDNAQLVLAYTEAFQVTGNPDYARVVRDVLDYLTREMRSDQGTFFAGTDADSEGEEGTYFLWTPEQVRSAVGAELAPLALKAFGVTKKGNFDGGRTVLRRDPSEAELAKEFGLKSSGVSTKLEQARLKLRAIRSGRIPPLTDRKQIVAWNGLAISAFARAGFALRDRKLVEEGARAAEALWLHARPEGRLARYLMDGRPRGTGMLDDHAFFMAGLLDLFEATGRVGWLHKALELQSQLDGRFFDDLGGGYYISPIDGEQLLVREKPIRDGAVPAGNSIEAMNLLRLYLITGNEDHQMRAEMTIRAFSEFIQRSPTGFGRMLDAVDFLHDRAKEILIVTPGTREEAEPFVRELAQVFLPNRILVIAPEPELAALAETIPLLKHKRAMKGRTTAYVCENRVCDLPARDVRTFAKQIRAKPAPYPVARANPGSTP